MALAILRVTRGRGKSNHFYRPSTDFCGLRLLSPIETTTQVSGGDDAVKAAAALHGRERLKFLHHRLEGVAASLAETRMLLVREMDDACGVT